MSALTVAVPTNGRNGHPTTPLTPLTAVTLGWLVLVEKARTLMGSEDLDRISTTTTTRTLRVDPIR